MVRERATVKLTKNGNSITVSLPAPFRRALGLLHGDLINLELHRDRRCLVVQKIDEPALEVLPVVSSTAQRAGVTTC